MKRVFCLLLLSAVLTGCAGITADSNRSSSNISIIEDVPFYEDADNQCGPSSLASVINYWQRRDPFLTAVTPEEVRSAVYSEGARGTLGMDLEFYAAKKGFYTKQYSGSIDDLRNKILDGIPVIILVDYGVYFYQRNHYLVITGFSSDAVIAHSGIEEKTISFSELERIWRKTRFWTLVVKPPE